MVDLFEITGILIVFAVFFGGFRFFGRFLPTFPFLNVWPITAVIFEERANTKFTRIELARSIRNRAGDWSFELKRSGLKLAPKKIKDLYGDQAGNNIIFMNQPTRETLLPAKLVHEHNPDLIRLKIQEETNSQLERFRSRELILKHSKIPGLLQVYLPIGMVIVALIGVAIYFAILIDPMLAAQESFHASTSQLAISSDNLATAIELITGSG